MLVNIILRNKGSGCSLCIYYRVISVPLVAIAVCIGLDSDPFRLSENGYQLAQRYWPEEGSEQYHIFEVGRLID